ncbi:MAG: hypothetical protein AB7O43_03440 [Hyphomicrobiaceae bacterium]
MQRSVFIPLAAALVWTGAALPVAAASSAVSTLIGTWGGNGRITYTDGSSEGIHCNAYYTGGGDELRMAIQCQSDKNPINIRSQLRVGGSRVTGTWEERTFNASGNASGSVSSDKMSLNVSGGGFNGTMTLSFSKNSQSVSITTKGIAMSRATMRFSRR